MIIKRFGAAAPRVLKNEPRAVSIKKTCGNVVRIFVVYVVQCGGVLRAFFNVSADDISHKARRSCSARMRNGKPFGYAGAAAAREVLRKLKNYNLPLVGAWEPC